MSVKSLLWSLAHGVSNYCFLLEPDCRGKGFGTEAVLMMMSYGKKLEQTMWGDVARPQVRVAHVGGEPTSGLKVVGVGV